MAVEAAVTQFRKEMVLTFEQRTSDLRDTTTKEAMLNGLNATFLVAGSDGARAVTRGTNGQIPYGNPSNSQVTATLVEAHATEELTNFNIFASQGNQREIMQINAAGKINAEADYAILAELANATQDFGTGTASVATVIGAKVILANQFVPTNEQDNMFAVVSPAFMGYLQQTTEFSSVDYVDTKPFAGASKRMTRWLGVNWIESPLITGKGTANEICYMYHRRALGYAFSAQADKIEMDYEKKQDSSWVRATVYHAPKILQNSGIIKFTHDGSAFVAT